MFGSRFYRSSVFYINCHAEELRELFVIRKGKEEVVVTFPAGTRHVVDFGVLC